LGRLRTLELVQGRGELRASRDLFNAHGGPFAGGPGPSRSDC
jgi:hypothetical protein